ncbi:mesaconyl-C4 CoA hydratase [Embleya sp. NPDC008237]|uniref:mesaconyl-C4 CoA hydratase n=1 Tax=Embleya sp. NPDC008237 TaxID=3363978 RepID=UPI0036E167D5
MSEHPTHIERREVLRPEPALALTRLLEVGEPDFDRDGLPLLWHWLYLLERPTQADLGTDGHPVAGVIPAPPEPGRRRMWAGGRATSLAPLRLGVLTTRRTEIVSSTDKDGRSGRLTFVVVRHTIEQDDSPVVVEEQDIVYRDAVTPGAPAPVQQVEDIGLEPGEWRLPIDPTLLFRFSALTYNAHRIHYDRDYAREVEGYAGLVTHGPLQAIAMAEAARERGADRRVSIDYRLVSPLLDHQGLVVSAIADGASWRTGARDLSGRATARGRVTRGGLVQPS